VALYLHALVDLSVSNWLSIKLSILYKLNFGNLVYTLMHKSGCNLIICLLTMASYLENYFRFCGLIMKASYIVDGS